MPTTPSPAQPTLPEYGTLRRARSPLRASALSRRQAAVSAAAVTIIAKVFGLQRTSARVLRRQDIRLTGGVALWTHQMTFPPKKYRKLEQWRRITLTVVGEAAVAIWEAKLRGTRPDWERETADASLWLGCDPALLPVIRQCCEHLEELFSSPDFTCWEQVVRDSRKLIVAAR